MPSSDLSHWLLLAQRLFHNLVALLCVPSTRFGHLFPPAGSPAFLWPSYSHLSRVPNLMGRDKAAIGVHLGGIEPMRRSIQSCIELALFPLDESGFLSALNNPFLSLRVRAK